MRRGTEGVKNRLTFLTSSPTWETCVAVGQSHFWTCWICFLLVFFFLVSMRRFHPRGMFIFPVYPPTPTTLLPPFPQRHTARRGWKWAVCRASAKASRVPPAPVSLSPLPGQCGEFPPVTLPYNNLGRRQKEALYSRYRNKMSVAGSGGGFFFCVRFRIRP